MSNILELCSQLQIPGVTCEDMDGYFPEDLDTEILPLVYVLNFKGYPTIASCSGHGLERALDDALWMHRFGLPPDDGTLSPRKHPSFISVTETPINYAIRYQYLSGNGGIEHVEKYPWVRLNITPEQQQILELTTRDYGCKGDTTWFLQKMTDWKYVDLRAGVNITPKLAKKDIMPFSKYLFNALS